MKLATRFAIAITIPILLSSSIIIAFSAKQEKDTMLSQIEKKGRVLSKVVAMSSINSLLNSDFETLRRYCETVVKDQDVLSIAILDNNLVVKMHSNLNKLGEKVNFGFDMNLLENNKSVIRVKRYSSSEYVYDIVDPIVTSKQVLGYVQIFLSSKNVLMEARKTNRGIFLIGLLAILFGLGGAVFTAGQISKPINKLARIAKEISHGDLNRRIDIRSGDEVGVLADAFRQMTLNLKRHIESMIKTERLAIIGKLSLVVAHEVRNPMEPIKGSAKLLSTLYKDDMTIQKYTGIIEEEINRLSKFLDGFLEFARPQQFNFKPVDINKLLKDVLILSEQYIMENDFTVEEELQPDLPRINADSQQLKQVFMNLILNAIQAKGNKPGRIKIRSYRDNNSENGAEKAIIIEFIDFGTGIREEDMKNIFEPFFTTKKDGTGLGLSTCLNIIEQHNGELAVESKEGEWTIFKIKLYNKTHTK